MRNNRAPDSLRNVEIVASINPYAEGSAEVSFGQTKVLTTASVEKGVPKWKDAGSGGWITAEYGMLPRSTHSRNRREASKGEQSGRTQEIQRLIGRSLRQAIDLKQIEGLTINIDCDVLQADGGTRTAAITGAWVALYQALKWCESNLELASKIEIRHIAALSLGIVAGEVLVDLDFQEDSSADFDLNLVFAESGDLIEIQGTSEKKSINSKELIHLVSLGEHAVRSLFETQRKALGLV